MIEVYSKEGCKYCNMTARLLKQRGLEFVEQKLDVNFTREHLLEMFPSAKTFPIVVVDGFHIGGYEDLVEHIKSNDTNQQLLNEGTKP
jgi:glutaredoxin 3